MAGKRDVYALIDHIYAAALDPSLWTEVLVELTDAVGGAQVMMGVHDVATRSPAVVAPRMDPEGLASYRDHWGRGDILWQRTNKAPVGRVLQAERFAPREEFVRTPIYNEWHRPLGIGAAGLGVNLFYNDGLPAVCGIKRPVHRDEFSADDIALFKTIAPHLVRAAEVQRRIQAMELAAAAVSAIGAGEGGGVILLDRHGRGVHADMTARRLLDAKAGLYLDGGHVRAVDSTANAALWRLIECCLNPDRVQPPDQGAVAIPRCPGEGPIYVNVAPFPAYKVLSGLAWLGLSAPAAMLMISDPVGGRASEKERLRSRFGLTSAESDLAMEIAKGDGREAAADRLGISVGTVRTHLMRIFDKTGVNRQAELVRLVMEARRGRTH